MEGQLVSSRRSSPFNNHHQLLTSLCVLSFGTKSELNIINIVVNNIQNAAFTNKDPMFSSSFFFLSLSPSCKTIQILIYLLSRIKAVEIKKVLSQLSQVTDPSLKFGL